MTQTFFHRRGLLLGALAALPLAVACAPTTRVNPLPREVRAGLRLAQVSVSTQGAAFESSRAADFASRLGPELQAQLRREFSDRLDPAGMTLAVEVQRFNLAGGTGTAFGRDQSRLTGSVRILERDGRLMASYPVAVIAGEARETRLGALASAAVTTAERFYRTLLSDFSRTTRVEVLGTDLVGARLIRQVTSN